MDNLRPFQSQKVARENITKTTHQATLSGAKAEQGGGGEARRRYRVVEALRDAQSDGDRAMVDRLGPHPVPKHVL